MDPAAVFSALVASLDHRDAKVRHFVASQLAKSEGPQVTGLLLKALHDREALVRSTAADGLGLVKGDMSRSRLSEALSDSSTRDLAVQTLEALKRHPETAAECSLLAVTLGNFGDGAGAAMLLLYELQKGDESRRAHLAAILCHILERAAPDFPVELLLAVSRLGPVYHTVDAREYAPYTGYRLGPANFWRDYDYKECKKTVELDCAGMKHLARQELSRRGLPQQ